MSLQSVPSYEVTFTLLNPQPDELDVSWDISDAIKSNSIQIRLTFPNQLTFHVNFQNICKIFLKYSKIIVFRLT